MTDRKPRRTLRPALLVCIALVCPLAAAQSPATSTRLFVEPFTTRQGSEELRSGVVAELRRLGSVELASQDATADLVLGGGGEVWVRGYTTLNPRAPRYPRNGKPVYGGFLSVELRDRQGETP